MQRMYCIIAQLGIALSLAGLVEQCAPARADLIRPRPTRSFPDIAGDIVGTQTYTYDPISKTGTFALLSAPHLISMGPSIKETRNLLPNSDGTLIQSLQMKLDSQGRLIHSPENKFQIHGTVIIGDKTYEGLLLEGTPTQFGADARAASSVKNLDMFDLDMRITGGELKWAFGDEAYLRISNQEPSQFNGRFTADFSSEKPFTNLRPFRKGLPASVPEPTPLFTFLACGAGLLACRMRRYFARKSPRRSRDLTATEPTVPVVPK